MLNTAYSQDVQVLTITGEHDSDREVFLESLDYFSEVRWEVAIQLKANEVILEDKVEEKPSKDYFNFSHDTQAKVEKTGTGYPVWKNRKLIGRSIKIFEK